MTVKGLIIRVPIISCGVWTSCQPLRITSQFTSVHFSWSLSEVSQMLPVINSSSAGWSDWRRPLLVLFRKIVAEERFLFPRLSPPGDRWRDVLDSVPAGTVSSSSACFMIGVDVWWVYLEWMCGKCTWYHKTFLVQSVYWHLEIKLYCIVFQIFHHPSHFWYGCFSRKPICCHFLSQWGKPLLYCESRQRHWLHLL